MARTVNNRLGKMSGGLSKMFEYKKDLSIRDKKGIKNAQLILKIENASYN